MLMKSVTLNDKYTLREGSAYMTGIQALVRLPMVQRWRDQDAGLNTGGFISGYRGSPLGGYDQELMRAKKYLEPLNIHFEPGLNEDLAATAVWGSQQVALSDQKTVDGVFGIWYGKGPGVDRSMDVFKHASAAGTSEYGGVLAIAGDDHGAKSSTLPHQTDHNFMAAMMPVLYPAGVGEMVEFGLLGLSMSRYTGAWVALKATADTVETSGSVDLSRERRSIIMPEDFEMPEGGIHIRWPDAWREQDTRLQRYKGFAAHAFARANKVDRIIWDSPNAKFGIIASGKAYLDVCQALHEMGITEEVAKDIGLRLYKVGMVWPLEPEGARRFAEGLDEIMVVEEKREIIEYQLMQQLYNWKEAVRPVIVGKHDTKGQWLLSPDNELNVGRVAQAVAKRLADYHNTPEIQSKLDYYTERRKAIESYTPDVNRAPYFCSGCPHNTSTKVPEGSRALAGIGCHIMAINMDRDNEFFTQMGGEGLPWLGQTPFTNEKHIFVNLGDGTYTHSGLLAIRAAVAAKVNITYKILFNDAVAMTGGQHAEGNLTVPQIAAQLVAEGVKRTVILSERTEIYRDAKLPDGVEVLDRDHLMRIQEELRDTEGCTALIYDQTCAAEKRRRRKRGLMDDPSKRVFINPEVCEGCGDCSVQSNCVSVEPLETELGRKRQINQSTCNKDYSCLRGFCPSFLTVEGGTLKKGGKKSTTIDDLPDVPQPDIKALDDEYNMLVTGIGGTGVLTIGGLIGMASHLDGIAVSILDMAGLAQKGGAVLSHVRLFKDRDMMRSPRIITGGTDLLMACDSVVAAGIDATDTLDNTRSQAVVNTHLTPVADFVRNRDIDFHEMQVQNKIKQGIREDGRFAIPATEIASMLMGDSIATNIFMLGYAWQKGLVPLSFDALQRAIELNGVAVDANKLTFHWGRLAAHDMDYVRDHLSEDLPSQEPAAPKSLEEMVDFRSTYLTKYQNTALAQRYRKLVDRVKNAAGGIAGADQLTEAVAKYYFKLLAYKDEYEVARLHTESGYADKIRERFDGDVKISLNLAPPMISGTDPLTGRPKKRQFGPWIFGPMKVLAKLKGLRGTPLDIFGYTAERKMERALIKDYEQAIEKVIKTLDAKRMSTAIELATLPDMIRGFGPVKEESIEKARARWDELLRQLDNPKDTQTAVAEAAE